jgi:DNA-binding transcriptional ArsR family regulator
MSLEASRRQLRALSHPLRLRILSMVTGAAMSSAELARELDMNHAAVSFHVRKLVDAGYLELAETRSVHGGQERRYRQRVGGLRQWQQEDPRLTVRAVSDEVARRASETNTEAWRLFGDAELWVEPAVWEDVVSRMARAIEDLHAAAQRAQASGTVHVSATAMLFTLDGTP